jgi:hypothetical protein
MFLMTETKVLYLETLDDAARKRSSSTAHSSRVAMGGYDLKFSGRAAPAWCPRGIL